MNISIDALRILERLENNGFEAYLVGGCVRDSLIGRQISDYDITTNALPDEIIKVFSDLSVITTGIKHGTVTVIADTTPFEITTYRIDGKYTDSRRPDNVSFTSELKEDLARRDFTVNAIAMDRHGNIIDPFDGCSDIKNGIIRCVGNPMERFSEDALRILRGIRFASQLGFEIEEKTSECILSLSDKLNNISAERIRDEFDKLICGKNCSRIMLLYRDVIAQFIPEIRDCFDFAQHSRYHKFDIYTHIVKAVESAPENNVIMRRTMFFHDIGKPSMFRLDDQGEGHFKGHAAVSAEMAKEIMKRLRYSTHDINITCELISRHSDKIQSDKQIRRIISKTDQEFFFMLIEEKKADNMAKQPFVLAENEVLDKLADSARRIIAENSCLKLADLAVNGNDMISIGIEGKEIGIILNKLLGLVVDEELPNDKTILLSYTKEKLI